MIICFITGIHYHYYHYHYMNLKLIIFSIINCHHGMNTFIVIITMTPTLHYMWLPFTQSSTLVFVILKICLFISSGMFCCFQFQIQDSQHRSNGN